MQVFGSHVVLEIRGEPPCTAWAGLDRGSESRVRCRERVAELRTACTRRRLWPCYEADRARALVRAAVVGAAMLSPRSMADGSDD